ncbi:hypothetical protein [Streptomyces sp. NPDC058614]
MAGTQASCCVVSASTWASLDEAFRETFIALARAMECTITAHRGR